jgi:hypothetical protein
MRLTTAFGPAKILRTDIHPEDLRDPARRRSGNLPRPTYLRQGANAGIDEEDL